MVCARERSGRSAVAYHMTDQVLSNRTNAKDESFVYGDNVYFANHEVSS